MVKGQEAKVLRLKKALYGLKQASRAWYNRIALQENVSLVTNFSDQKLLVTIITNLDTSLQSKKIIGY